MNAITIYRIANWCYRRRVPLLPAILQGLIFVVFNSYIPYRAQIGRGVKCGHRGIGVVINADAVIGERVLIRAHVTIGKKVSTGGAPRIGSDVQLGDGAKVLGEITVGEGAVIGANAVVLKDVPPKAICVGVPASVVGTYRGG